MLKQREEVMIFLKTSDRDADLAAQREKIAEVLAKETAELKEDNQYLKELVKLQRKVTHGMKFTNDSRKSRQNYPLSLRANFSWRGNLCCHSGVAFGNDRVP